MKSKFNGFKQLEQQIIDEQASAIKHVSKSVKADKESVNFLGKMIDLYVPNFISSTTDLITKK